MSNCTDKKNPLQRNGTAQSERLLPGMQKDYVLVDENSFPDWIVFAREFGEFLHFYDHTLQKSGNWAPFFSTDTTAILGTIAMQDVELYRQQIKSRFDFLKNEDNKLKIPESKDALQDLFSIIYSYCAAVDHYFRLLPADSAMAKTMENLVKNSLAPSLKRLIGYYKPNVKPPEPPPKNLLGSGNFSGLKVLGRPVQSSSDILNNNGLSNLWWMNKSSWNDFYNSIQSDAGIYGSEANEFRQMMHAANHNLFSGIFDTFLMGYSKMIQAAEKELLIALETRNTHPAHYGLFLAFLKLFRTAQNDINTITKRHLDFYYKDILQLKQAEAQPNSTHLLVELAKPVPDHILKKDTLFKAGKDSAGKDVAYSLDAETSFNKASVSGLRSVYLGNDDDDDYPGNLFSGRLFASPVANSDDGIGAKLTSDNKEWHPMASRLYSEGQVFDMKMPAANIGFAIASSYLYLQEGEREVRIRLSTSNNGALLNKNLQVFLTTEKEWFEVSPDRITITNNNSFNNNTESCAEIYFSISGDDPAITEYNSKVHEGTLSVSVPVVKIILKQDPANAYEYNSLKNIILNKFEIAVSAGNIGSYSQTGIKNISLANDQGIIDGSKAFQPFGSEPVLGNKMVIGSREMFTKKNLKISFNIEWKGLTDFTGSRLAYIDQPDGGIYPNIAIKYLKNGIWENWVSDQELFPSGINEKSYFKTSTTIGELAITDFSGSYNAFGLSSKNGFISFELLGSFGHKEYLKAYTTYLINLANGISGTEPQQPYAPVIKSLFLSYSACSDVVNLMDTNEDKFQKRQSSFFHLYPFGETEQHVQITKALSHQVLPQFSHKDEDGITRYHQGEFYIGLQSLQAQQAVSLLFQVMDGTADPTISKPDDHIYWSFLSDNKWIGFKKEEISDATNQLIQSGIIQFTIPAEATTENKVLPAGLLWIRAAVQEKVDAICKLIAVDAQATVATFKNQNNADDFLETALPASTISKLKEPQSAVKKLSQPYPSFGGRPLEGSDAFYIRVSERLRHKDRAVTIWDYEHLILQAFPLIHKVKCLNHTKSDDAGYNEVLPGHVTIITIPDLKNRNDINPLKPYTSQAMLKEIEAFIKKRISCHVNLHVVNPFFEEVKLTFNLKLATGYNDFTIYSKQLKEDITGFLSPWAYGDAEINFGGIIHKSVLINFIEERPYVDFITDVEMAHYDADKVLVKPDNDTIVALYAKSILVSVPASQHVINEITESSISEEEVCNQNEVLATGGNL